MDEPKSIEGKDLGPDPFTLLASLAACMLSTLRMYIDQRMGYS
jgi:putative redox protein